MLPLVRRALKNVLARTRFRRWLFYRHSTTFRPAQMVALLEAIEQTHRLAGTFVEIGCYEGATTIWLNLHLDDLRADPRYVAIDTFDGFVRQDVQHEVVVRERGAYSGLYQAAFADNKREWVEATLELNGVSRVELIAADANTFDYESLGAVAFALVDVDLYRPVAHALEKLWPLLLPGGVIAVDDCDATVRQWDGALQAYQEFCHRHGLAEQVVQQKLGMISKPAS